MKPKNSVLWRNRLLTVFLASVFLFFSSGAAADLIYQQDETGSRATIFDTPAPLSSDAPLRLNEIIGSGRLDSIVLKMNITPSNCPDHSVRAIFRVGETEYLSATTTSTGIGNDKLLIFHTPEESNISVSEWTDFDVENQCFASNAWQGYAVWYYQYSAEPAVSNSFAPPPDAIVGPYIEVYASATSTPPAAPSPEATPLPLPQGFHGTTASAPPPNPKIVSFKADKTAVKEGGGVILTWETEDLQFLVLEGRDGDLPFAGYLELFPTEDTIYTLKGLNQNGITTAQVEIQVLPRDPVIIVPGILGSWGGKLDPILRTYDGLINGLKSVGYEEGKNLFRFPYDWRQDNRITAGYLSEKINEILAICQCEKVDVIAHSMGGLVSRYYIQNINDQTIDQLIFLGTPHLGAPKAYLGWEGGEMGKGLDSLVIETNLKLESLGHGYLNVVNYIQEKVTSIKQLLPTFDYLSNHQTGENYLYSRCREGLFGCNEFLEKLSAIEPKDYLDVETYNIVSDSRANTIVGLELGQAERTKWQHGKPHNYPNGGLVYGVGDQTVPVNSADWGTENTITIKGEHVYLPYYAQSNIAKILVNKEITELKGPKLISRIFFVGIKSPADISLSDSNGTPIPDVFYSGPEDPEFIVVPDPAPGEYQINVVGTGEGPFEIEVSLLGDDIETTKSYSGDIKPGEQYVFSTLITEDNVQELWVDEGPTPHLTSPTRGEEKNENFPPPGGEGLREGGEVLGETTSLPRTGASSADYLDQTLSAILYILYALAIMNLSYLTLKKQKR